MKTRTRVVLLGLLATALSQASQAQTSTPATVDPRTDIATKLGARPDDVHITPIAGMYEITQGAKVFYVSADAKYSISGDLVILANNDNLSEQRRREVRAKLLAALPESEMLVFGPKDPKYTITVFTDVDCAYCRELHNHMAEYNQLGIRVRYLAYPRTGPNSESWNKAVQVWCSTDRNAALTAAKRDQPLTAKPCTTNPVAQEYALGQDFELPGTPALVLPNGELVPGYLPPEQLVQHLRESQGKPQG